MEKQCTHKYTFVRTHGIQQAGTDRTEDEQLTGDEQI